MSRAVRAVILPSILCLGLAARATAKVAPWYSRRTGVITLVTLGAAGRADPLRTFTVNVRDPGNVPQENSRVVLDFSGCPDIHVCADQRDPTVTVDCVAHTLMKLTSVNGQATFRVVGCAANQGASPGSIGPSLRVFADGVYITPRACDGDGSGVRVAALDQNGGGLNGMDLRLFLTDFISGKAFARSDYDGNGVLGANDLSRWLTALFAGGSAVGGSPACP